MSKFLLLFSGSRKIHINKTLIHGSPSMEKFNCLNEAKASLEAKRSLYYYVALFKKSDKGLTKIFY